MISNYDWHYYGYRTHSCDHCDVDNERVFSPWKDGKPVFPLIVLCATCKDRLEKGIHDVTCSNCGQHFDEGTPKTLILKEGDKILGGICVKCTQGVAAAKILIERFANADGFHYGNFVPVRYAKAMGDR